MKKIYMPVLAVAVSAAVLLLAGCGKTSVKVTEAHLSGVPLILEEQIQPEALHTAQVVPMVSGRILSGPPDVGALVREGQLLFTIDDTHYRTQAQEMQARLSGIPSEEVQGSGVSSGPDMSAEAALLAQGVITRAEYERIRARKSVSAPAGGSRVSVPAAGMVASLQAAEKAIEDCRVTAPIGGIVSQIYMDDSRMALAGHPVLVIREDTPVGAELTVLPRLAEELKRAKKERTLTVSMTDGKYTWYGELKPQPGMADTGFSLMRVQFDNSDGNIAIGQRYTLRVETTRKMQAFLIPKTAFIKPNVVAIVTKDGLIDMKTVTISSLKDNDAVVVDGLSEGDRIVVQPPKNLQIGMEVSVS